MRIKSIVTLLVVDIRKGWFWNCSHAKKQYTNKFVVNLTISYTTSCLSFVYSVEQTARDTIMTTRLSESARRERLPPSFLASRSFTARSSRIPVWAITYHVPRGMKANDCGENSGQQPVTGLSTDHDFPQKFSLKINAWSDCVFWSLKINAWSDCVFWGLVH